MLVNLKAAIAASHVTQSDIAFKIHISPGTFSEFVHGRRELAPHLKTRIAEILNADPAWIFATRHVIPAPPADSSQLEAAVA